MKNIKISAFILSFAATLAAAQQQMKCRIDEVLFEGIDITLPVEEYQALCKERLVECLEEAVDSRDCAKTKALVELKVDVNSYFDPEGNSGHLRKVALHVAAVWGYADVVEELLQAPDIKIDIIGGFPFMDSDNLVLDADDQKIMPMTPLLLALAQGEVISAKETGTPEEYEKIVELLIQHQTCCRIAKDKEYTCEDALLFAIKHGTPKMVKALIAADARVDEKSLDTLIMTHIDRNTGIISDDWLAVLEELVLNGADIDASIEGLSCREWMEDSKLDADEELRATAEKMQNVFDRVEERNKETSLKAQEFLMGDKFLINDLAKIVATYISK